LKTFYSALGNDITLERHVNAPLRLDGAINKVISYFEDKFPMIE